MTPCGEALASLKQTQQHQARGAANWAGAASTMFLHSVVSGLVKDLFLFRSFEKKINNAFPSFLKPLEIFRLLPLA